MVEIRRGSSGDAARERLPWLEPVEDEDDYAAEGSGYGGLILAAILVLVAIALLTAGVIWYRGQRGGAAGGDGQIIKAEPGPYKVRPPNPGGMKPDANGEVTYDTSAGQDVNSPIDLNALPEQPMVAPGQNRPAPQQAQREQPQTPARPAAVPQAPVAKAAPQPAAPPVAAAPPPASRPAPVPQAPAPSAVPEAGGVGTVQLGAFSSEAKAKQAWKTLSGRYAGLRDLGMAISPVKSDDKTLYRLRASGAPNAARLCAQLRVAGESCSLVN
ncbi:SPOR domain-containing protein [Sphingomonas sp. AP4-R1]|uniref:SPOR domain-containing protein n=1 Tax=Sphingomonas sp. AP4-R1 TaxID=2735134 RepID=UPI0014933AEF|nr:SPOR domain-containing protein [Sphingomonas sp. AP4-R1]QJU57844.1 SPOR domain-containing protein [Sphingomonas sp. AP4-R1]